jgi:MraZ protein
MFRGINSATLDGKGRMALPTRFRESLMVASEGKIVVTIDTGEKCLLLYPLYEWEIVQRKLEGLPNIIENARRLQRLLIGHATDIDMDGQGRILLPAMLREFAGLDKKLVLVGQGNKLEVWSEALWLAEQEQALEDSGPDAVLPDELLSLKL